jgi:hypothetical protein
VKIVYHIGLHCTDDDQIQDCLLRNGALLADRGILVPDPAVSRPVVQAAMIALRGRPASQVEQQKLLQDLGGKAGDERLILSNSSFLCIPKRALRDGEIYPLAAERATWIRNLFPDAPSEFAIALRNPATQIPAMQARFRDGETFGDLLARLRPLEFSLAAMVEQLRAEVPDCPLTIWCNEDAPLIWPAILRSLTGLPDEVALSNLTDMPARLLTVAGVGALVERVPDGTAVTDTHWLEAASAVLSDHARPEAVEQTYDLPGWTQDLIGTLTGLYEQDVSRVSAMDGVTVLSPVAMNTAA